jgi:hypothetical protein
MKTRYFWTGLFNHCISSVENGQSFRHRFMDKNGKTADGRNEKKTATFLDLSFWESCSIVHRISRASFRQYLKTGNVPKFLHERS